MSNYKISKPSLPDYDHCLVNFANSILKHFGAETTAPTLDMADRYLEKDPRNVVVLLLDAMGVPILERHTSPDGFFRSHLVGPYRSVFPPTTVAATTSIDSGLYPCEHGWLGWDCYFPKLDKNVTVFLNCDPLLEKDLPPVPSEDPDAPAFPPQEECKPSADFHVAGTYCGYKSVITKIREAGGEAYYSTPFMEPYPKDLDAILSRVTDLCQKPGKKYIYAYWNEPDTTMHRNGISGDAAHDVVNALEKRIDAFASTLPEDTLLFITADHGHMEGVNHCITDYPEIKDCLVRPFTIEPRALNFFVKEEKKAEFPVLFKQAFGDAFWLLTKEEVLEKHLFGKGKEHPEFRGMLGDYLAVAISDESILQTYFETYYMIGGHAGSTEEEYQIPLIVIEK